MALVSPAPSSGPLPSLGPVTGANRPGRSGQPFALELQRLAAGGPDPAVAMPGHTPPPPPASPGLPRESTQPAAATPAGADRDATGAPPPPGARPATAGAAPDQPAGAADHDDPLTAQVLRRPGGARPAPARAVHAAHPAPPADPAAPGEPDGRRLPADGIADDDHAATGRPRRAARIEPDTRDPAGPPAAASALLTPPPGPSPATMADHGPEHLVDAAMGPAAAVAPGLADRGPAGGPGGGTPEATLTGRPGHGPSAADAAATRRATGDSALPTGLPGASGGTRDTGMLPAELAAAGHETDDARSGPATAPSEPGGAAAQTAQATLAAAATGAAGALGAMALPPGLANAQPRAPAQASGPAPAAVAGGGRAGAARGSAQDRGLQAGRAEAEAHAERRAAAADARTGRPAGAVAEGAGGPALAMPAQTPGSGAIAAPGTTGAAAATAGTGPAQPAAALQAAAQAATVTLAAPQPAAGPPQPAGPALYDIPVPIDQPGFGAALGTRVSLLARDGLQEARLSLNPVEMGPVTVQISVDGNAARVSFMAEVAATREAISASLPALAGALQEAGLTLAGGGVSQQMPQGGGQPDRGTAGQPDGRRPQDGRGEPASAAPATSTLGGPATARRGLVDLVA